MQFNLTCEENEKWISMVGMFSQMARLVFLPIMSHLSDRYDTIFVRLENTKSYHVRSIIIKLYSTDSERRQLYCMVRY